MLADVNALEPIAARYAAGGVYVLSDAALPREGAYASVSEVLRRQGPVQELRIEAGEAHKSPATLVRIWEWLLAGNATREALLVCVGGGTLTDIGGFAAATYKRGIRCLHVPTTLLAMVDASIGGKTGINVGGIKNAAGAFYPPVETLLHTPFLDTLPHQELLSGYGEMLKHALLDSEEHWHAVLRALEDGLPSASLILRSQAVKQRVVAADPGEQGLRRVLNLGHTTAHALEALRAQTGQPMPHGYAVAYGLLTDLYLSHVLLGLDKSYITRMTAVITEWYGRPSASCRDYDRLLRLMRQDKKNTAAGINFTLLRAVGQPERDCYPSEEQIREAVEYLFSI